jgi:hypothetical protein
MPAQGKRGGVSRQAPPWVWLFIERSPERAIHAGITLREALALVVAFDAWMAVSPLQGLRFVFFATQGGAALALG